MARYIDADELMREVEKAENSMEFHGQEFSYSFLSRGQEISTEWYYVEELIDHAPTVDVVEVKHGYFIGTEFDGYADGYPVFYEWKCSECGCIFEDEEPTYNYCPQCGAKMDGKETEDARCNKTCQAD